MDPPTCGIGLESNEGCAWYIIVEACWFEPLLGKLRRQNEISVVSGIEALNSENLYCSLVISCLVVH